MEVTSLDQYAGQVLLIVNVASQCGLTPQYAGLEKLQQRFNDRGFTVIGFPCNQFMGQEPGTMKEIIDFCSTVYGVSFPIFEKIEVNGESRHPLFAQLANEPDVGGVAGDIEWNFEKFLISRTGAVVGRFRPKVAPESDEIINAIESQLAMQ
uniref:glutathione peroxidase n=1 Tax=Streptomyces sp. CB02009 TaxID=1703938 RepID=UPI000D1C1305|nr:glutathione peroxidase [Streptomyces sp. CB02009]